MKDYAKLLFVNPNYLNEKVKKETGFSASYLIHQSILIEIKKMLIKSHVSLSDIAQHFNFPNTTHLIRFFKKIQNQTPVSFRKQYLAK